MENNVLGSLQDDPVSSGDGSEEKRERLDFIPILLFVLLLGVFYDATLLAPKQNLALFLVAALLLVCFLLSWLQTARKLKASSEQAARLDHQLAQARAETGNTREELARVRKELTESNLLFDNYNLQLEITTSELQASKSETDAILATVKQGVFLIGSDGNIGSQYSEELKQIFQINDFAFRNFLHLLRPLVPESRYRTITDYLKLFFNPRKNEKQLQRFNPLKCMELNFQRAEGGFQPKHVEFTFHRVVSAGEIKKVLVTAVDVSERVKLEAQLREGEERREKQLELLCDLLNVESSLLRGFMEEAQARLEGINRTFRELSGGEASEQAETLLEKVNGSFRLFHNLKSQAAALGLGLFEKAIHEIENLLHELRRKPRLSNEDLLNVLVLISGFQTTMREAAELIEKVSGLRRSFGPGPNAAAGNELRNTPTTEMQRAVEDLARTVMTRSGKKARIEWNLCGFDDLPITHRRVLRDGVFQLVRNSIVHGIEAPEERSRNGKEPCGTIAVTFGPMEEGKGVRLCCRDDGAGLNAADIRKHAVNEGMLTEAEAQALSENDLYALIFEPGFSTAAKVTEDAGRGVGLDALHSAIAGQLHGEIRMEFYAGSYCQFELMVPLPQS